jgi:hypothetical protein
MSNTTVDYNHHDNFESSSATISTISGADNQVRRRNKPVKKSKPKKQQVDEEPGICEDIFGLIRSKKAKHNL